jgi:hypothetical protein
MKSFIVSSPHQFSTFFIVYVIQTDSQVTLNELSQSISSGDVLVQLSVYCNREYDNVEALLTEMNGIITVLLDALQRTIDLISCERIVPIYHRAIYDATCQYSVSAMFWIFSGALIMGFFGLVMILCRAAYKPTIYDDSTIATTARDSNNSNSDQYVEPKPVAYDDGPQQQSNTPYNYTPPRKSYFSISRNPQQASSNHQADYSPNKSSIYMDDSPGRNASYY